MIQVYRGENILRGFDDDIRAHLRAEMEQQGIKVLTSTTVTAIEKSRSARRVTLSDGSQLDVDKVMFAIGRKPNTQDLGLEATGVKLAWTGGIAVDEFSQTSVPNIYAVGDVTNRVNLTPVAIREGQAFAETVFGGRPTRWIVPTCPRRCSLNRKSASSVSPKSLARTRCAQVDIYRTTFRPLKASLSGRETLVLMKLVVDGSNQPVPWMPHRRP